MTSKVVLRLHIPKDYGVEIPFNQVRYNIRTIFFDFPSLKGVVQTINENRDTFQSLKAETSHHPSRERNSHVDISKSMSDQLVSENTPRPTSLLASRSMRDELLTTATTRPT